MNPEYGRHIVIAEGIEPENGKMENDFKIEMSADKKPTILEDGTVDYKELNYVLSVT